MIPSRHRRLLILSVAAVLAACASTPQEATVQVFTGPTQLPAGSTYRYERLPSQAAQPRQAELEAAADALLARAGLRRDEAAPRLSVQLTSGQDPGPDGPWGGPYSGGPSVGVGISGGSGGGGGVGIGLGFPIGGYGVRAARRMDVQIRDRASGAVLFQAQASAGGGASPAALLRAALRDFPNARPGTRHVPLASAEAR